MDQPKAFETVTSNLCNPWKLRRAQSIVSLQAIIHIDVIIGMIERGFVETLKIVEASYALMFFRYFRGMTAFANWLLLTLEESCYDFWCVMNCSSHNFKIERNIGSHHSKGELHDIRSKFISDWHCQIKHLRYGQLLRLFDYRIGSPEFHSCFICR